MFPDRWPGVGLLLLRVAVSVDSIGAGWSHLCSQRPGALFSPVLGIAGLTIAVFLLAGFLTPIAASAAILVKASQGFLDLAGSPAPSVCVVVSLVVLIFTFAALVLLGPGAFSIDARLFGRREIIIPKRSSLDPGTPPE
jgi:uncharacterized membrane protein YphA (DoxX/SURF4 family)